MSYLWMIQWWWQRQQKWSHSPSLVQWNSDFVHVWDPVLNHWTRSCLDLIVEWRHQTKDGRAVGSPQPPWHWSERDWLWSSRPHLNLVNPLCPLGRSRNACGRSLEQEMSVHGHGLEWEETLRKSPLALWWWGWCCVLLVSLHSL